MRPKFSRHQQTGAGLPVALFIITVLALLVIGMAQLQESSSKGVSLQIQSQRAFFAAESGAQVVVAKLLTAAGEQPVGTGPTSEQLAFNSASGLAGCTANVDYNTDGGVATVKSFGVCGDGTPEEARRTVEVRLR